ncbi:MAG: hypothetical protein KDA61_20665, partial [Planctomycetales bacterium]|nr:hypothetical protein [Planctomycetales bacterium]
MLTNDVTIVGDALHYSDASPTGQSEADVSSTSIDVPSGPLVKSIYALNGSTTLPSPFILSPGDEITYRLQLTLPTSDVEDLALDDYLPLPVLLANEVTTFDNVVSGTAPAAGHAQFGPTDTFGTVYGGVPALSSDVGANRVSFTYGDFDVVGGGAETIDILFTVTASDDPFADGLQLTNQARRSQDTTNAANFVSDAIVQVTLGMPDLQISKGVVAASNPAATFSSAVGPVSFSAPGSAGYRGSATIESASLATTPVNANVTRLDAGDLVTFAIVVENTGSSRAGAFDLQLRDTLPTGFVIPGGGLNLSVTDGTGAAIAFTTLGSGLFDASGGIELTDPGPTSAQPDLTDAGALDQYSLNGGRNIAIVTYDLEIDATVTPNLLLTNTATLFNYAGSEGGPDFSTSDLTDNATARTAPIGNSKSVIATNQGHTVGNNVAIGEIATYRAVLTVPEGDSGNVTFIDAPSNLLSIIDVLSVTPSSGDLTLGSGTFNDVLTATVINSGGDSMALFFPGLSNANRDDSTAETITIEYRAVVLNDATADRGDTLTNLATVTWSGGVAVASATNLTVVEPTLAVAKSIVPASGQASDVFTVTLTLSHATGSNADAFNVTLSDPLPAGLLFDNSLTNSSGLAPSSLSATGNTVTATFNQFAVGQTSQIQFNARLATTVSPGQTLSNVANAAWTSLPGDVTTPQSSAPDSTERTGATSDPGGAANDYRANGSSSVSVINPSVAKSVVATNQAHTSSLDVAIGEIVTYETTLTIPQGSLSAATLVDTPDAGLAIVDVLSLVASP